MMLLSEDRERSEKDRLSSSLLDGIICSDRCDDRFPTSDISLEESHHRLIQMHIVEKFFDDTLLGSGEGEREEGSKGGDEGVVW